MSDNFSNTIKISSCTDGKIATIFLSHRKNRKKMESCLEPVLSLNSTVTVHFEGSTPNFFLSRKNMCCVSHVRSDY